MTQAQEIAALRKEIKALRDEVRLLRAQPARVDHYHHQVPSAGAVPSIEPYTPPWVVTCNADGAVTHYPSLKGNTSCAFS